MAKGYNGEDWQKEGESWKDDTGVTPIHPLNRLNLLDMEKKMRIKGWENPTALEVKAFAYLGAQGFMLLCDTALKRADAEAKLLYVKRRDPLYHFMVMIRRYESCRGILEGVRAMEKQNKSVVYEIEFKPASDKEIEEELMHTYQGKDVNEERSKLIKILQETEGGANEFGPRHR